MIEQTLAEEINKRDVRIRNLEKVIEYIKRESKERGEEIVRLKKQLETVTKHCLKYH